MPRRPLLSLYKVTGVQEGVQCLLRIAALSPQDAMDKAHSCGLSLCKVRLQTLSAGAVRHAPTAELQRGFQQLSFYVRAGLPVVQAVTTLLQGTAHRSMQKLWLAVARELTLGGDLAAALAKHPAIDRSVTVMLAVANEGGDIAHILGLIQQDYKQQHLLARQLRSAMLYPMLLLVVGVGVLAFMLIFVVPQYVDFFHAQQQDVPASTQRLLDLSRTVQQSTAVHWLVALAAGYLVWRGLRWLVARLPAVADLWHRPYAYMQVSQLLATMTAASAPVLQALDMAAHLCRDAPVARALAQVKRAVTNGQKLSHALRLQSALPPWWSDVLEIAEHSGDYTQAWDTVRIRHRELMEERVQWLMRVLEPLLIAFFGGMIVALLYVLYTPVFSLGTAL